MKVHGFNSAVKFLESEFPETSWVLVNGCDKTWISNKGIIACLINNKFHYVNKMR
jgi:hypothetical protein